MWCNIPDNWSSYYRSCGSCGGEYHASEGSCDCKPDEDSNRPWLAESGYELDDKCWVKTLAEKTRVCRRDHKDGTIKKGQVYTEKSCRVICDDTGDSWIKKYKKLKTKWNFHTRENEIVIA